MLAQLIDSARLVSRLAADDFRAGGRTDFLHRLVRVLIVFCLLLLAVGIAHAAEPVKPQESHYTVEIVIFRAKTPLGGPEAWQNEADGLQQTSTPAEGETEDAQTTASPLPAGRLPVHALPSAQFRLSGIEAALQRNPNYEVLHHAGWVQAPNARGAGLAVNLADLGTNNQPLRGAIGFERGKYLYLQLDLTYTPADPPAALLGASNPAGPVAFTLKQKRRIRPFERHYFDHPAFGVIAIVTPVK